MCRGTMARSVGAAAWARSMPFEVARIEVSETKRTSRVVMRKCILFRGSKERSARANLCRQIVHSPRLFRSTLYLFPFPYLSGSYS